MIEQITVSGLTIGDIHDIRATTAESIARALKQAGASIKIEQIEKPPSLRNEPEKPAKNQEPGGPERCVCPECGHMAEKERGVPCRSVQCPECGAEMIADVAANEIRVNLVDKVYRTKWEGRDWLVVPTVMIKAGVLNGELVSAEELAKFPGAWNGRPFTIGHPKDEQDMPISAAAPDVMERFRAGYVFGAEYDEANQSVPAELWVDVVRTMQLDGGPELIRRIKDGESVEVSTGYFRDRQERSGEWQGKAYNGVAKNLRPDHLAALLDTVGACSWQDGCGCPRTNENSGLLFTPPTELAYNADSKEEDMENGSNENTLISTLKRVLGIKVDGASEADVHQEEPETMAKSKKDMVDELCSRLELNADDVGEGLNALNADALRAILNAMGEPPAEEPEPEEPEQEPEEEEPMPQEAKDETPEPEAEPVQEQEETEQEDEVPEEEPQANEQPCAEIAANQAELIAALERRIADLEQRSEAQQSVVNEYQEAQASEKAKLVSDLAANERCAFSKDDLEQMGVPQLQKLARSLMPGSYAGQESRPTTNVSKDDRPVVLWNPRAAKEK